MAGLSVVLELFSKPTTLLQKKNKKQRRASRKNNDSNSSENGDDKFQEKSIQVTLLEKKDYYEYVPCALRCMVNPSQYPDVSCSLVQFQNDLMTRYYRKYPTQEGRKMFKVITNCQVTGLNTEKQQVNYDMIESEESQKHHAIPYDYLIVATGAGYSAPYIKADWDKDNHSASREKSLSEVYDRLLSPNNKHIVVVGGGSVGCELVGELNDLKKKNKRSDLKITLVHGQDILLERCGQRTHNYVNKFMQHNDVTVMLNDRVIPSDDHDYSKDLDPDVTKVFSTKSGKQLNDVTMIFWCTNSKPRTSWIEGSGLALSDRKTVAVNKTLQSISHPNVFSVGDCNDFDCEKSGANAHFQGELLGRTLLAILASKKDEPSLPEYKAMGTFAQNISLGAKDGAFAMGSRVVLWGRLSAAAKDKINYYAGIKPFKHP